MGYTHFDKVSGVNGVGVGKKDSEVTVADATGNLSQLGVQITATGAELNNLTGVVAGTATANKAAVLGATKNLDALEVAAGGLTLGGVKLPGTFSVTETLQGAAAATAANYGVFFIVPFACEIVSAREAHTAAGTDAAAVTLDIEKLTGTQAPDAGVSVLGATIDLKGAANTVQAPALTATTANKQLAAGDRLCLKDAGVLTAVAGVAVTVELKAI